METREIINIVFIVIAAIGYGVSLYFRTKGNIIATASELIAKLEKTNYDGPDKMTIVVDNLYEKVPLVFKDFLSKKKIRELAQKVFDWTLKYAKAYIKAKEEKDEASVDKIEIDAATDIIASLVGASLKQLQNTATELGINIDELKTKDDIARAIAQYIFNKA